MFLLVLAISFAYFRYAKVQTYNFLIEYLFFYSTLRKLNFTALSCFAARAGGKRSFFEPKAQKNFVSPSKLHQFSPRSGENTENSFCRVEYYFSLLFRQSCVNKKKAVSKWRQPLLT